MQVVAILGQSAGAVRRYAGTNRLPFPILIDAERQVMKAYGVWHRIGLDAWNIARPAVFLIDRERRIRYSFVSDGQTEFPWPREIDAAIDAATTSTDEAG